MKKYITLLIFIGLFSHVFAQSRPKQKIIFDCDLGDDIDDAYALGLLLTLQDQFEIIGITTCYGRTEDRALLAKKFLQETGQSHIPVFAGRNTSNSSVRANWYADQFYWSKGFVPKSPGNQKKLIPNPTDFRTAAKHPKTTSASDFILHQLNQFPNEIIIFSVGPVTNLADVLQKDSNALKKAKKIVAMFGSFFVGYNSKAPIQAEWNVICDIPSAQKFVQSGANITYAGLDVTAMVKLEKSNRDKLLQRQSPLTNALTGLYVLWGQETPTLFDPVAIGMVMEPDLFKMTRAHVFVDDKGFTKIDPTKVPNAEIGQEINTNLFIEKTMKKYLYQNLTP